jgi:FKBP-type peptidyl-prolyl cis-trans isomerase
MFRKKRDEKPTPPWLIWLVVAFLFYAVIANRGDDTRPVPKRTESPVESKTVFNLDLYKDKLLPTSGTTLRVKDTAPGSGLPAICGQQVKIRTRASLADGSVLKETPGDAAETFTLGEKKLPPLVEENLIGMLPGGARSLIVPANMAGIDDPAITPNTQVKLDLELLEAAPALPDGETMSFRVADIVRSIGKTVACGDTVTAHVTIWNIEGKKLYSSKDAAPLHITPGASELFLGLEQGVIGMKRGGLRTLIVPPAFQKPLRGNAPTTIFPWPKNQTVLVDVEAVQ